MALKLYMNYFGSKEPFDWQGDGRDARQAHFNMLKRFYEIVCQRIFDKGGFINSRQGDEFKIQNTLLTSFEGIKYIAVVIKTPRDSDFNSSDFNFYFLSTEIGSLWKNGSHVFEHTFESMAWWDEYTFPAPAYLQKDIFNFDVPNEEFPKEKSNWYKLYLKDKSIYADNSYRMFKAKHKVTNELAIITMVGGGLLATGFKGSSSEIFREATNQTAKSIVFHTKFSNSSVEMPYKSYNYINNINANLSSAVKEVENVSLVQKIKDWGTNLIGNVKSTGVYCLATGNQALLKALGFIESSAGMYILRGSVFLTLSKSLGEGSEIGQWKIISADDVTGSSAEAISKQSEYWDAVNEAIRKGNSHYTTDTAGNTTHTGDTSATENEDKASQSIESLNKSIESLNKLIQNIANNISSSTSANTTVQTAIQNAINNLIDVNRNGLQGIQNNIGTGTGTNPKIDLNIPEGTGIPILTSQLEYMLNTTSGLPIQTQPLAQLLIDGLAINMDSVKNGIDLNAPKLDDINLKLDSQIGTQLKEMSDNIMTNKEKESKILDSQIENIPKNQDILDLEHKAITQKVYDLDYAQRQAKTFKDLHSPATYTNEDGVTLEKGYYSNPSLSQAREYNDSIISHGKIEGAKSFPKKIALLKEELLKDGGVDKIIRKFSDINPEERVDIMNLIKEIKL